MKIKKITLNLADKFIFKTTQSIFKLLLFPFCSVEICGFDRLYDNKPIILAANHQSYLDGFIIYAYSKINLTILIDWIYYRIPVLNLIAKLNHGIPIAPKKVNEQILKQAYEKISQALEQNRKVVIFPEGFVTRDGKIASFKEGIERILKKNPVPVVPVAISGLWGSIFSFYKGKLFCKIPKKLRPKVKIVAGDPIPPEEVTAKKLQEIINKMIEEINHNKTIQ